MPPRLFFASTEPPAVGGSSTASVALCQRLRADGWDVHYVALLGERRAAEYRALCGGTLPAWSDPERFAYQIMREPFDSPQPELSARVERLAPDIAVGFGFQATIWLKRSAPWCRTIFVTGSCRNAQDHVTSGRAPDAVTLLEGLTDGTHRPQLMNHQEEVALALCDLLVAHSPATRELFERFFPSSIGKQFPDVVSFAEWIADRARAQRHRARPFADRDIDVLFVASEWARTEKNYPMVRALAAALPEARLHVVGEVATPVPRIVHHGFLADGHALFDLMGRARVVACPSRIDAAPGILVEGAVMGCNLVASKNCGNWELCHPDLLADPFGLPAFTACLRRGVDRKYDDRLPALLAQGSYRTLQALLEAFARPIGAGATEVARTS